MGMTRETAIDLAVRRHLGQHPYLGKATPDGVYFDNGLIAPLLPLERLKAIRAHFRVICRQYGVKAEPWPTDDLPFDMSGPALVYSRDSYDGHSLRI